MTPDLPTLYDVIENTWPPASTARLGPWTIRRGSGGGQRVSAATAEAPVAQADLEQAETAMQELSQPRLFMIRHGQDDLDHLLADNGYALHDPVNLYSAPVETLATEKPPRVSMFTIWEPLQMQFDIWAAGGIGPGRIAVMDRAPMPKTSILSRWDDHPAASAFVGIHDGIAMTHAIEVLPDQRRKGVARWLMRAAAFWAQDNGAHHVSVVCTQRNTAANGLYASLGMDLVGQYHYRLKKD